MKFENFIKRISAIAAAVVVFLLASGMYLSTKGFMMNPDGSITLVKNAYAAEASGPKNKIDKNVVLPEGNSLGEATAPVTLYEFSSYGCFHCAHFQLQTLPKVKEEFIDKGLVRVVFSDFPLDGKSMQASLMSHCFKGLKYFRFSDLLFEKQREWSMSSKTADLLKKYAYLNGLAEDKAQACLDDKAKAQEIMEQRQYAINHLGISGTPSFVVSGSEGREILYGAPDYETLKGIIEKNLPKK